MAAIGLDDRQYAREFSKRTGIQFPLLIDEKREAYQKAELRSANLLHLLKSDYTQLQAANRSVGLVCSRCQGTFERLWCLWCLFRREIDAIYAAELKQLEQARS